MGTSSTSLFTGASQFSSDLQQVLQRAMQLASLPLQQMQADSVRLQSQATELSTLNMNFSRLQTAIQSINSAAGANSFTPSVSDSKIATASVSGSPMAGTYTLKVSRMGTYAAAMSADSLPAVSDPAVKGITDGSSYTLTVGLTPYTITPSGTTLSALADALNRDGHVQATLVNIGSPTTPDYRLSVESTQFGDHAIQLKANNGTSAGQSLLAFPLQGMSAQYQINGQPTVAISTDMPEVTLSTGLKATILAEGVTTIQVSRSTSSLASAFSSFASAYNTAMSELNKNHGSSGGALSGQSIISSLSQVLRGVTSYEDAGASIKSITDLGFSFDQSGVLSFDTKAFSALNASQVTAMVDFLGSASTGGFLKAATSTLVSVEDSTAGLIPNSITTMQNQIKAKGIDINDEQSRLNRIQISLTQQMNAADAAIASMEQQVLYFQGLFTAMQVNSNSQ